MQWILHIQFSVDMFLHGRDVHFSLTRLAGCAGHGPGSWLLGAAAAGLEQLGSPHLGKLVIVIMMMMMMAGALSAHMVKKII